MINLVIDLRPEGSRDLHSSFSKAFGSDALRETSLFELGSKQGIGCATQALQGAKFHLYSSRPQNFWDVANNRYLNSDELASLIDREEFNSKIENGVLCPSSDAPFLVFETNSGIAKLYASAAGSGVFYYLVRDNLLFATDHLKWMRVASQDAIDPLAVAEIIRFGANYGARSIISSVHRVPFGHQLEINNGSVGKAKSYIDYSWRPQDSPSREALKSKLIEAISSNIVLTGEAGAELLFSSGVDSSLLGALGVAKGKVQRGWFMSLRQNDDQFPLAELGAQSAGFDLETVSFDEAWDRLETTIAAYSEPTLDFSILPTYQLIQSIIERSQAKFLLDGTGGDAWFGFGSLSHARIWKRLRLLAKCFRRPASYLFTKNLHGSATKRWLFPMMVLSRVPITGHSALGHLCANSAWQQMLRTSKAGWIQIENEIIETLNRTGPNHSEQNLGEVILSDASMIAVAQFAAKSGQYDRLSTAETIRPFLMPNVVAIGRQTPIELMMENGEAKPLLKEIATDLGFERDYIYREKSGFQPPIESLLRHPANQEKIRYWICEHEDEMQQVFAPLTKTLYQSLLKNNPNCLNIKSLYPLWGILAVRIWLHHFRQLNANV